MTKGPMRSILAIGSLAALAACDQNSTTQSSIVLAPTRPAFVGTMASLPAISIATPARLSCILLTAAATRLDLLIAASSFVDVEQVTFRLMDGTHIGGSPITIPRPQLNAQFGSTRVQSGTTRVFAFQPQFLCGSLQPTSFAADVVFFDAVGARQIVTVSSSPVAGQ